MAKTTRLDFPRTLSIERLRVLLDAYGAAPERWPDREREGARALLAQSAAARALTDEAASLDRLLDAAPGAVPSPGLALRVLAGRPRARRIWPRLLAAAVPLAAAAALVLWLGIESEPERPVAKPSVVALGEYSSPTDVLLQPYGVDVSDTVPSVGCSDSTLGCPDVERATQPYSQRGRAGSLYA